MRALRAEGWLFSSDVAREFRTRQHWVERAPGEILRLNAGLGTTAATGENGSKRLCRTSVRCVAAQLNESRATCLSQKQRSAYGLPRKRYGIRPNWPPHRGEVDPPHADYRRLGRSLRTTPTASGSLYPHASGTPKALQRGEHSRRFPLLSAVMLTAWNAQTASPTHNTTISLLALLAT
jgi:hypothetical protein